MADTVTIDLKELQQAARGLGNLAQQPLAGLAPLILPHMVEAQRSIKALLSGPILRRRSGHLAGAVGIERPAVSGSVLTSAVGVLPPSAADSYAALQLRGGTITAKNGGALAIPLPGPALTPAGVPRFPSPLRETLKAAFPLGTFVAKGVLFGKLNKNTSKGQVGFGRSNIVALFALKRSVTIPVHDYISGPRDQLMANASKAAADYMVNRIASKS